MRIVRFNGGRIGVLSDGHVFDATDTIGLDTAEWPPVGMVRMIRGFDALRPRLQSLLQGHGLPVEQVKLDVPILWPNKLIAYPVNYLAHAEEMKSTNRADITGFFLKAPSSLSGPQDPIVLPDLPSREIHHECELAIDFAVQRGYPRDTFVAFLYPAVSTVDEARAWMLGFRTRSCGQIRAFHHRPQGAASGRWDARIALGRAAYYSGYSPIFMIARAMRHSFKGPAISGPLMLAGYCQGYLHRWPRLASPELVRFVRRQQVRRLLHMESIWQ